MAGKLWIHSVTPEQRQVSCPVHFHPLRNAALTTEVNHFFHVDIGVISNLFIQASRENAGVYEKLREQQLASSASHLAIPLETDASHRTAGATLLTETGGRKQSVDASNAKIVNA